MLKILHAADIHLNSRFSSVPSHIAKKVRQAQKDTVTQICSAASEKKADIVLLAGDLFDAENSFYDTSLFFRNALSGISAPVFISPGNHDFISDNSPYVTEKWSENVHIFKSQDIERIDLDGVCVYGAGFTSRRQNTSLLSGFHASGSGISLGVFHGDVDVRGSQYNPITLDEIAASKLDYLALGHIHQRTPLKFAGNTAFCYSGCAVGRGFDEAGEKGFYFVTIDDFGKISAEFMPLSVPRFEIVNFKAGKCFSEDDAAAEIFAQYPYIKDSVVRLFIQTGENLSADIIRKNIEKNALYAEVNIEKNTEGSLWQMCGDNSLQGVLMQRLKDKFDSALTDDEKQCALQAAKYAFAAIKNIYVDDGGEIDL